MADAGTSEVTQLLEAAGAGDEGAAERLLPVVYDALRELAERRMDREPPGHTLQPTALVHEAYLRLVGDREIRWANRAHFFAAAAEAMRRILVERARRQQSLKRGGGAGRVPLLDVHAAKDAETVDLVALDEALARLEDRDPGMSEIVKLRFFAGLTIEQTAEALGIANRTINRRWIAARAWLRREMTGHPETGAVDDAG
jgi:RNA polymerase sigma factor (TIGR02999 family)